MRIGLNLTGLVPGETGGVETYARQLAGALGGLVGGGSLTLLAAPELVDELRERPWVPGARVVAMRAPGRSRLRRTLAEQLLLPGAARRAGVEVLHNLQSTAPAVSGSLATVTTVHDLLYHHHPDTHSPLLRRGMAVLVPIAVRRSDRVIAISRATRDDLVASLGADPARIDVVHSGPGLAGSAPPTPAAELRAALGLDERPFLVSPSARRAHKNLDRLLDAFARVDTDAQLVLPGYATGAEDALARRADALGIAERVRFLGWVTDSQLEGLYAHARALVFPSLAEGFGLPVLEAMRHGLPVVCADRTSLPEIAGDAALLFDPESVEAIRDAIAAVLGDERLRERLAAAGRERAAAFSWEATARGTLASYERALA